MNQEISTTRPRTHESPAEPVAPEVLELSAQQRYLLEILSENDTRHSLTLSQVAQLSQLNDPGQLSRELVRMRGRGLVRYRGCGAGCVSVTLAGIRALLPANGPAASIAQYIRTQSRRFLASSKQPKTRPDNAKTLVYTANAFEALAAEIERSFQ